MKRIVIIAITLSMLIGCISQTDTNIKKLDVVTFKNEIDKEDVQLIDVRTPKEFKAGHIETAKLIDFLSNDFNEKAQALDKTKPVYLYCKRGGRSAKASKVLNDLGFTKIYDLKGGFLAWLKDN